jgi:membrane protein YqaA with SNARE-associated domain
MSRRLDFKGWAEKALANAERMAHLRSALVTVAGLELIACLLVPLPIALLIMALVTAAPRRWLRFAMSALVGSLTGGVALYIIGAAFWSAAGDRLIRYYRAETMWSSVSDWMTSPGGSALLALACVSTGLLRIACLAAGLAGLNPAVFLLLLTISRGVRWVAECGAMRFIGEKARRWPSHYFKYAGAGAAVIAIIALLIIVLAR